MKKYLLVLMTLVFIVAFSTAATAVDKVKLIPAETALLIVDVVNDVLHKDGVISRMGIWKYAEKHNTVVNIAKVIESCQKNIPIIRIFVENRAGEMDYPQRGAWRMYREMLGSWMVENTWGAKVAKG